MNKCDEPCFYFYNCSYKDESEDYAHKFFDSSSHTYSFDKSDNNKSFRSISISNRPLQCISKENNSGKDYESG